MTSTMTTTRTPALWTPGDWNAFFGFGTNILVDLLVLTGLLRFVLKMPDELVFGRILPVTGLGRPRCPRSTRRWRPTPSRARPPHPPPARFAAPPSILTPGRCWDTH